MATQNLQGAQQTVDTIAQQIKALQDRIASEGITNNTGQYLVKPTTGTGATFNLPEVKTQTPDMSTSAGRIDYFSNLLIETQKANEALKKQQEEFQKAQQTALGKITEKPTLEQTTTQAWSDLGIQPAEYFTQQKAQIAEVQTLKGEYDKAVAAKEQQIANIEAIQAPMDYITRRVSAAEKNANIRLNQMAANINTKLGIMEMEKGNFAEAQDFVKTAAANYTYDLELQYKQFEMFYQMNKDTLSSMDKTYQDLFDKSFTLAQQTYEDEKNRYEDVLSLMIQYPRAGIIATDSLEVASAKAGKVSGIVVEEKLLSVAEAKSLGVPYGTTKSEAIAMGKTPTEIPAPLDYIASFQAYKDAGWTREQLETSWLAQYNQGKVAAMQLKDKKEMEKQFPEIKSALDEVYKEAKAPSLWQKIKGLFTEDLSQNKDPLNIR